jgi:hypothetical protein
MNGLWAWNERFVGMRMTGSPSGGGPVPASRCSVAPFVLHLCKASHGECGQARAHGCTVQAVTMLLTCMRSYSIMLALVLQTAIVSPRSYIREKPHFASPKHNLVGQQVGSSEYPRSEMTCSMDCNLKSDWLCNKPERKDARSGVA